MPYSTEGDFFLFKNSSKKDLEEEVDTFLRYNKHTKLFKKISYDFVKLKWTAIAMKKPENCTTANRDLLYENKSWQCAFK